MSHHWGRADWGRRMATSQTGLDPGSAAGGDDERRSDRGVLPTP